METWIEQASLYSVPNHLSNGLQTSFVQSDGDAISVLRMKMLSFHTYLPKPLEQDAEALAGTQSNTLESCSTWCSAPATELSPWAASFQHKFYNTRLLHTHNAS